MKTFERLTKNRQDFLEALVRVINKSFEEQKEFEDWENEDIRSVQRIFINAPWGMGKTLFADALQEYLSEKFKNINTLYVNSWKIDFYNEPMKALIAEMSEDNTITIESTEKAKKFLKNFLLKRFNLNDKDIEEMKSFFNGLDTSELENYKKLLEEFKDTLSKEERPKIIIIDELDRCRPDYAIQLLEIIKHIFDVKNIIFLFLINREQLESIVSTIYMNSNLSTKYFEKFYNIELNLPEVNYEELNEPEFEIVNDFKEYKVDKNGCSNNRDLAIQKIFLDIAFVIKSSLYLENNDISIRNIKKLLKKFNILKDSLIEEEKEQYILILALITYFFIKELNLKAHRDNREIIVVIIEKYLKKIGTNILITDIILEAFQNDDIQNQNIDIYKANSKCFNKNENYQRNFYQISVSGKKFYLNNFKKPLCENFSHFLYLSVNVEEATFSLWLEKKYNFIK